MIQSYQGSNICEIEEIISKLYHIEFSDDKIVIFPFDLLVNDGQIKLLFKKYMDVQEVIKSLLKQRIKMDDDIRMEIEVEEKQNDSHNPGHDDLKWALGSLVNAEDIDNNDEQKNSIKVEIEQFLINYRQYIAICIDVAGYLFVLLRD